MPEINSLPQLTCPSCRALVSEDMVFCPACGITLRTNPKETSLSRQIIMYTISVLLPPFGFWYGWKFIRQSGKKEKIIGWIAISLTIISIIINVWVMVGYLEQFKQSLGVIDISNY